MIKKIVRFFLKNIAAKFVFCVLYRVKIEGLENIPSSGRVILAANHASYLDPMVLYHSIPRKFHAVTINWLFNIWWLGWVFKYTDCVSTGGSTKGAVAALENEKMLLIFPEGRCRCDRHDTFTERPHKGVAVFALKTGAPIIPIAIKGTYSAWPTKRILPRLFKKLTLHIGPALHFDKYSQERIPLTLLEESLTRILSAIKNLLKPME